MAGPIAQHATVTPSLRHWNAQENCRRAGVFRTDDGKALILDTLGLSPPGSVTVATMPQFVALLEAAYADAVQNVESATEELAQRATYGNRLI